MLSSLLILLQCTFVATVSVKNDDCTYEFDMDNNHIYVSCSKNVTLTIMEKEGIIKLLQDPDSTLWFESKENVKGQPMERFSSKFTSKLKSASRLMKRLKSSIETRIETLDNITVSLSLGDSNLRNDLIKIKQIPPSSPLLREAMVAALQN